MLQVLLVAVGCCMLQVLLVAVGCCIDVACTAGYSEKCSSEAQDKPVIDVGKCSALSVGI